MRYLVIFLFSLSAFAAEEAKLTALQIQSDLNLVLQKIIPSDQFVLQTTADTEVKRVREVLQGVVVKDNKPDLPEVPDLPGFDDNDEVLFQRPEREKKLYQMVDKTILKKYIVRLNVDEAVEEARFTQAETLVKSYLSQVYGDKAVFYSSRLSMTAKAEKTNWASHFWLALPWFLLFLLTAGLFYLFYRYRKQQKQYTDYKPVMDSFDAENMKQMESEKKPDIAQLPEPEHVVPQLEYKGLTDSYIQKRTEILQIFMEQSEAFRNFFTRLDREEKAELSKGLHGPAYENFLEAMAMEQEKIQAHEMQDLPTEAKLNVYLQKFHEFLQASQWKRDQFLGFLEYLSFEQMENLLKEQDAFTAALILKHCKSTDAAKHMLRLEPKFRAEVMQESSKVDRYDVHSLTMIEQKLRQEVEALPNPKYSPYKDEINYWASILDESEDQDLILQELKKNRPEVYPGLKKFHFQLDDANSLSKSLIQKVLSQVDNENLARSFQACAPETAKFLLQHLNEQRRAMLESQMQTMGEIPEEQVSTAKRQLLQQFRENI